MPMVRRAAATNLGKFAATIEQTHLKTDIMSMFETLTQDGMVFSFCARISFLWNDINCFLKVVSVLEQNPFLILESLKNEHLLLILCGS